MPVIGVTSYPKEILSSVFDKHLSQENVTCTTMLLLEFQNFSYSTKKNHFLIYFLKSSISVSNQALLSTHQEPVLTKDTQVRFIAIVTNGLLNHILELTSMLLICFNFLQNVKLVIRSKADKSCIVCNLTTNEILPYGN